MKFIAPLLLVGCLLLAAYVGVAVLRLEYLFGVVIPYLALLTFLLGSGYRVWTWARAPVPYRIPTTAGQAKSLDWIPYDRFESPYTRLDVVGRMALEVLLFRSLFRNTVATLRPGPRLTYTSSKWLWLGALVFHWALLIVAVRHYRFFLEPVPWPIGKLNALDGFLQVTLPAFYISDALLLAALAYLLLRRCARGPVRFLSLGQDYFPLYLIAGIAISGVWMRYGAQLDVVGVKALTQSLVRLRPEAQAGAGVLFHMHLFLVCVLGAYFPFSKLMHAGGVFLSPTRNLANNSRARRHINPVNPTVPLPSYRSYEEAFKNKMIQSGIPLD
jgi:nitrate reductase gamma subunit